MMASTTTGSRPSADTLKAETVNLDPETPCTTEDEDYSVFTRSEKWCIVAMVSYAAWFSTLSSLIYFPALKLLADTFAVSVDKINLTITAYMAVATVAPTLAGDAADVLGRRPAYLATLGLFVVANICLARARSFGELLGLRVLQALGISGTRLACCFPVLGCVGIAR